MKFATEADLPMQMNESSRQLLAELSGHAKRSKGLSSELYNLTISHHYRFVWFRVAKVGTRTILEHFKASDVPLDVGPLALRGVYVYRSPGLQPRLENRLGFQPECGGIC